MSKSWVRLIVFGIIVLIIMTGYEVYRSLTGQNQEKRYNVIEITGEFDQDVFEFLADKETEVRKPAEASEAVNEPVEE